MCVGKVLGGRTANSCHILNRNCYVHHIHKKLLRIELCDVFACSCSEINIDASGISWDIMKLII